MIILNTKYDNGQEIIQNLGIKYDTMVGYRAQKCNLHEKVFCMLYSCKVEKLIHELRRYNVYCLPEIYLQCLHN